MKPADRHLLAGLSELISGAKAGRGGTVVIRGAFGSGRSTLLAAAATLAKQAGFRGVTGLCHFTESGTRLGLAGQLTEALFGEPADKRTDEAAGHYWRLRQLAAERPLLVCVDDLQWADVPSLHWLCYLARRIHSLPILVAVTIRDGEPAPDLAVSDLEDSRVCRAVVRLGPLDTAGVATAVRRCYPAADDAFCAACERLTGGNPWLLSRLLRVLGEPRPGMSPQLDAATVEHVMTGGYAVSARINSDLERLCHGGVRLARAIASLDSEATPDVLAAVTGIPRERCDDMTRTLVAAGFLREGSPVGFAHPLIRSSLLWEQPATSRAQSHGAAADYLYQKQAPTERIAVQLANTPPGSHPWAGGILADAARAAARRGGPAALPLVHRALQEDLPVETAAEMFGHLGRGYLSSDLPAAAVAYKNAAARTDDAGRRMTATLEQAAVLLHLNRIDSALRLLEGALASARAGTANRARAMHALALALRVGTMSQVPAALEQLRRDCAGASADSRGDLLVWGMLGLDPADVGERACVMAADSGPDHLGLIVLGMALLRADETVLAAEWSGQQAADAAARGELLREALARVIRSSAQLALGRLEGARRDAAVAQQRLARVGCAPESAPSRLALAFHVEALLKTGALTEAADLLTATAATGPLADGWADSLLLGVRGMVAISRGDCTAGLCDLRECEERMRCHPAAFGAETARLSEAALIEHRLGHARHAHDLAVNALTAAEAMRNARCVGMALHALGVTATGESQLRLLTRSAEILARTPARLASAAVEIELGSALRRANRLRQSRHLLRQGHATAISCGARDLASRSAGELVAARGRIRRSPAGPQLLTGSEERVAALACDGLSNSEIAGHLFIARRTVETHLTRIYRKLGISGRTELASALGTVKEQFS